ncbi:MAG: agmatine deiminase family protein [Tannerella sp.]|jgi:agmatine/peptidylarginine deiminase|nr:agmatine deiminase family protein [Tannerella sp.]
MSKILFPAEWAPQSGIQLTWPHEDTDWAPQLDEAVDCFLRIAREIIKHELLLIVAPDEEVVRKQFGEGTDFSRIRFRNMPTNDTWARDHGGISVYEDGKPLVLDFVFNGWGLKYPANYDNLITRQLLRSDAFAPEIDGLSLPPFVLEGGSIDTDGQGTLLTTEECLTAVNRNDYLSREQIEFHLKEMLGIDRVLWLEHGFLMGDDTNSHVDMLARFCNEDSIAYVKCEERDDPHFDQLQAMERQLQGFTRKDGQPYRLFALPLPAAVHDEQGYRLPASYANFLILNGAVLVPTYGVPQDEAALSILKEAFPGREVTGVNCRTLIRQHGSLHCVTMQYPEGFIL